MGLCNNHDVLDQQSIIKTEGIYTCQGAIKNIISVNDIQLRIILYDGTQIILQKNDKDELIKGERFTFVFFRDQILNQNQLINILPPAIIKFNAIVVAILDLKNESPEYDTVETENGTIDVKRYELIFIEGTPRKRVYIRADHLDDIEIGAYYEFECVTDNEDRSYWYRIININKIGNNRNIYRLSDTQNQKRV